MLLGTTFGCWLLIQIPLLLTQNKRQTRNKFGFVFRWRRKRDFRLCDLPDKQWVSTVYPNGKLLTQFSPYSNPTFFLRNKKRPSFDGLILLAEKEGFEPSLRLSHTTPLAGEPLRPLGYFSKVFISLIFSFYLIATLLRFRSRGATR